MSETVIEQCKQALVGAEDTTRKRTPGNPALPANHGPFQRRGNVDDPESLARSAAARSGLLRSLWTIGIWTLFLLSAAALPLLGKGAGSDYGLSTQRAAPDFTLSDAAGKEVTLEDFAGRFVYLMFGYLNCPDICHTQALLFEELNLSAGRPDDLTFVFVAIDPARDRPEAVHAYFDERGEGFVSLHGDDVNDLQRLALKYHATFRRQPGRDDTPGYLIDHTGLFYLLGPDGRLRYTYAANQNASPRLLADLKKLRIDYELL